MTQAYALRGMRSLGDFRTMWNQGNSAGCDASILAHQTMAHIYPEGELQVELIEKTDAYWLIAELPNIQQDDVTMQVSGAVLSIVGEWPEEATAHDSAQLVRPYRMFARQFRLEEPVAAETLSTTYTDGLLAVCVPKLAPSQVESPSLEARIAAFADPAAARRDFIARQPMGRLGTPEEIAAIAVYLAGDESAYTTGQVFVVDGGITI